MMFLATFASAKISLAAEEKKVEIGEGRETGNSNGLGILGLGLRLQNQGMELLPCPCLSILRLICSLANCTTPENIENTICFFHALEKANLPIYSVAC